MQLHRFGAVMGVLALVGTASAQAFSLPNGTIGLTPIEGQITDVETVRVPLGEATTGLETQVTLEFTLQGCLDSLMPLMSHYEIEGDRATLYVTALNANNEASQRARCFAIPQASAQVELPGRFEAEQIDLVFLGQSTAER